MKPNAKIKALIKSMGIIPEDEHYEVAEAVIRKCARELREAEQKADRAFKAGEVKERNTFDGYDFAEMLEERFGIEE
jgi:copper oxidase (laccase) domain-containing protein